MSAIRVIELSKKYRIRHQQKVPYESLREVVTNGFKKVLGKLSQPSLLKQSVFKESFSEDFFAVDNVSFEVSQGERVGIIGRNGAGKSTILKLLSRITEPSGGQIRIRGRVASLLEVGTGFHPELTGRENIFLNGAVLGMGRTEIKRKLDQIIAFSGVEQFLDTPVKRYSSGMYVRLAFAVAAHLEPDILIIDEVLAVGDYEFQKKCLGKMAEVSREGRTVIFVSHSMPAVSRLCNRAIVMKTGKIVFDGTVDHAVHEYMKLSDVVEGEVSWPKRISAPGNDVARLLAVRTKTSNDAVTWQFDVQDEIVLEMEYVVLQEGRQIGVVIELLDCMGQPIAVAFDNYVHGPWDKQPPCPAGRYKAACVIPGNLLTEGDTSVNLRIFSPPLEPYRDAHVAAMNVIRFSVVDKMLPGGARGAFPYSWGSPYVRPKLEWRTEKLSRDVSNGE